MNPSNFHPSSCDCPACKPPLPGSQGNPFTFKYQLGQKLFFDGRNAEQYPFESGKIYEGKIVGRSFSQNEEGPEEEYVLIAGQNRNQATVLVEHLGRTVSEVRDLNVERLGEKKTS